MLAGWFSFDKIFCYKHRLAVNFYSPLLPIIALIISLGCGKSEDQINSEFEKINSNIAVKFSKRVQKTEEDGSVSSYEYTLDKHETGGEDLAKDLLSEPSAPSWAKGLSHYGVIDFSTTGGVGGGGGLITLIYQENRLFFCYDKGWRYIGSKTSTQIGMKLTKDAETIMAPPKTFYTFDMEKHTGYKLVEAAILEATE